MNNRLYGNLIFELSQEGRCGYSLPQNRFGNYELPVSMRRAEDAQLPECDEMTVVRHYTNLSANNFGVDNGFYPLGSCTMKYNPKINEEMAALPQFSGLHPMQPAETTRGAEAVCTLLCKSLCELTGLHAFTLKPFAGAHGELTGLMVIKKYHESRGDENRRLVIVPDSAHGTNPASAAVCGMDIIEVKSLPDGTVDVEALKTLLAEHGMQVAAMMMTNPNTLGLFERQIPTIEKMVHAAGGLMYYDGANLNPMLGVARPGDMGFDVMHINLHKTFSTPHGGGGPGAGPVGVRKGLESFFPNVSPYHGNFAVAMRAYAYILSLGRENLKMVGPLATLNANYIKECLKDVYELPIDGLCKHEFVFDGLKDKSTGVTTMDVAKRLLDYGYHAPTIYFPLLFHESLMIEPTENESKETIDGFIQVMRQIAEEAKTDPELVKSAPHNTPIGRVDDVLAAKHPVTTYRQLQSDCIQ
ncbi:aminomethyl-transferring glycine dehydrogenase subunit GcvPB [Prevotella sp. E13-17]|uniref:aminomethyl-transferring glycine dehydrogenase subunit GcvPB n=1 Tax=Prevotella sp. E13-17 TaxID=2913616 RepID=UPI001EDB8095|nr:aminomethyl-transferring glycine dehydrogenase subunit GcvPB [Prevotella sp. E13-17]UKK51737.1 aminomethyl-transferring glycine dehydrogenase subunit GcvPB [Prevotella sp. E13-17]